MFASSSPIPDPPQANESESRVMKEENEEVVISDLSSTKNCTGLALNESKRLRTNEEKDGNAKEAVSDANNGEEEVGEKELDGQNENQESKQGERGKHGNQENNNEEQEEAGDSQLGEPDEEDRNGENDENQEVNDNEEEDNRGKIGGEDNEDKEEEYEVVIEEEEDDDEQERRRRATEKGKELVSEQEGLSITEYYHDYYAGHLDVAILGSIWDFKCHRYGYLTHPPSLDLIYHIMNAIPDLEISREE
ncbi:hypothetical protein FXO38_05297 [Capsicum annuum]|nr:hypothetical protein FXO37_12912 [Capsicum annuum]KAF3674314.1 hypothetical protein FXO38_05297 [Capsicum annuum]